MRLIRRAVFFLLALISQAQAQGLSLPGGIALEPNPSLDLTYQVVPDYDPVEKVIAVWEGDKLQYFVSVEKLPPGWLDHSKYFQGLVRDLRAAGRSVETGRSGSYKASGSLSGQFLQVRSRPSPQTTPTSQSVHFISDGKVSFVAIATLVDRGAEERMSDETKQLFQSASLRAETANTASSSKAESPYMGTWKWSGNAPNGRPAASTMRLKDDLSFSTEVIVNGEVVFSGVGVWSVSGQKLLWTYLRSVPLLSEDQREDEDEIVVLDRSRLVLRSKLSGKEREFIKQ